MKLHAVVYLDASQLELAELSAGRFSIPCVDGTELSAPKPKLIERLLVNQLGEVSGGCAYILDREGLRLVSFDRSNAVVIAADFCSATTTYRRLKGGGKGQMIAKSVGVRAGVSPSVLDATAGLGGDAFVLASVGCEVEMVERSSVVRSLLADAMMQALRFAENAEDPELASIIQRMRLIEADSLDYLQGLPEVDRPDVVYLDPMFPERTKQSLVKKEMRVFHSLVGEDEDADQLLPYALEAARYRVVVKRPRIAPYLNGLKPNHELSGKSNRFDVYTKAKIPSRSE